MLILADTLREQVIAHARDACPEEACGILAGPAAGDRPTRLVRMRNILSSAVAYQFDAAEWLALNRQMDARGEDPLVFYHSHTSTEARPSAIDVARATEPDALYLIVSLKDRAAPVLRAWRIAGAVAVEEEIRADQPHKSA
jgi:proteasome lid subunit RPN8/RPN11